MNWIDSTWGRLGIGIGLILLVAGCGGPGAASPTPIPADSVRAEQPTPFFPTETPLPQAPTLTPRADGGQEQQTSAANALVATPVPANVVNPLPTVRPEALGIVRGGTSLVQEPGGERVQFLPAGSTVSVTGRSVDGAWWAVYTDENIPGWIGTSQLILFSPEELPTVTQSTANPAVALLLKYYTWDGQSPSPAPVDVADVEASAPDVQVATIPTPAAPISAPQLSSESPIALGELQGRLAIQNRRDGQIFLYDLESGDLVTLGSGADPAISPDGQSLAFVREGEAAGLYLMELDTRGERKLYGGDGLTAPAWNPAGDRILFSQPTGVTRCWEMGFGRCVAEEEMEGLMAAMPAAQRSQLQELIAAGQVSLTERQNRGLAWLAISDIDSAEPTRLAAQGGASSGDWRSGEIVYTTPMGLQILGDAPDAVSRPLTQQPLDGDPVWQPDGERVFFQSRQGESWQIASITADGAQIEMVTAPILGATGPSWDVAPAWSPDGQHLIFLSNRSGTWALWVLPAGDTAPRRLVLDLSLDYAFQNEQVVSWGR